MEARIIAPVHLLDRFGLRVRAVAMIGAVLMLFGAVSIGIVVARSITTAYQTLEDRAAIIADLQAHSIAIPLYAIDLEQVTAIVRSAASDPDYLGSVVRDPRGEAVVTHGDLTAAGYVEVSRDILGGAQRQPARIGEYRLRLSTVRTEAQLLRDLAIEVGGGAIVFLAAMAVLFLLVTAVGRPLTEPTRLVGRLAEGDYV